MKRNLRGELTEPAGPLKYSLTDQIFIRCVAKAIEGNQRDCLCLCLCL